MEKMADRNDSKKGLRREENVSQPPEKVPGPSSEQTALDTNDLAKDVVELKVQVARVEEKVEFLSQMARDMAQMARDMGELKVQMARLEERLRPIPQMDERIKAVEQSVLTIKVITKSILGLLTIAGIIVGIIRFLLPLFD